jgi:hypothetical protein
MPCSCASQGVGKHHSYPTIFPIALCTHASMAPMTRRLRSQETLLGLSYVRFWPSLPKHYNFIEERIEKYLTLHFHPFLGPSGRRRLERRIRLCDVNSPEVHWSVSFPMEACALMRYAGSLYTGWRASPPFVRRKRKQAQNLEPKQEFPKKSHLFPSDVSLITVEGLQQCWTVL